LARFSLLREELRRAFRELRGGGLSPARGAASVALGLFVGTQPIFGLHLPVIVALCLWLGLDAVVAYAAANISNPFFAPVIVTGEVQVGAYLRTGAIVRFERALSQSDAFSAFARDLALGAPVVGLALAAAGFVVTFALLTLVRRLRPAKKTEPYQLPDDAPVWVKAVERVANRYSPSDGATAAERSRFHYVRIKLLGDPIAKLIAAVEGEADGALGEVVDVGTGRGQLPILLLELGRATRARGFDWDRDKVEAARKAAAIARPAALPLEVEVADMREAAIPEADTVLLVDVLHYVSVEAQDALLDRAARAVRPGGRVLVREADTERGWRSAMTLLEERIFTALRYNRGERVRFRPAREIAARLEAAGLACEVRPAWGKTPFSNVLVIGRRPSGAA
jgi:uncharacterized protein (DUF2062 family)/SAM-dependent methyltransferase